MLNRTISYEDGLQIISIYNYVVIARRHPLRPLDPSSSQNSSIRKNAR
jgi:hypothetical protein